MVAKIYRQAATWAERSGGNGYMGISLHSISHTGDGLRHMIDWVNEKSGFSFLRIGLSDTLNRFNYMADENLSEKEAIEKALGFGNRWLEENSHSLSKLKIPYEIIRWDHWERQYPDLISKNRKTYTDAYADNEDFRNAMLRDMQHFTQRRYKIDLQHLDCKILQFRDYLIEEVSVYEEIYKDYPNTTVYPGNQLNVVAFLRSGQSGLSKTFPLSRFERLYIPVKDHKPAPSTAGLVIA